MSSVNKVSATRRGFTIVELIVVIVVIGILAGITIVGYGAWRKNTNTSVVKSDLTSAATAMDSARTFNNVYPAAIPTSFTPSTGVTMSGGTMDGGKTYCIDAVHSSDSTIAYFMASVIKSAGPLLGSCSTYNSLAGWWSLNGDVNDSSPGADNGTVVGPTLTTGFSGTSNTAYGFAGGQYITFPAVHSVAAGSISLWFQSNGAQPASPGGWYILSIPQSSDNSRVYIRVDSTGTSASANLGNGVVIGSAPITTTSWNNIIVTWSGTNDKFYVNGVDKTTTGTFNGLTSTGSNIYLGCLSAAALECVSGKIDDVRVYNRALTAPEIQNLYSFGAQG